MKLKLYLILVFAAMLALSCDDESPTNEPVEEVDPPGAPPKTWIKDRTELTRVFYDDDIAVYYDGEMDPSVTWPFDFIGEIWRYTKEKYDCTPDQRLYAVLYGKGSSGTASYYYSKAWDYRNTIICYSGNWNQADDWPKDLITHEIFHIVESVAFGVQSYSAGYGDYPNGIWGDSQFAPIFQHDIYKVFGMDADAKRWEKWMETAYSNSPNPYTYWSANWFLPIYKNHGGGQTLQEFFRLIGEHFPANRKLNIGEFIHFFSGAAGVDLKEYGQSAFGWSDQYEYEWVRAQEEFPMIVYQ